ncbi:MAG: hypothetical protein BA863_14910 [Desulfovibrio sp. S3730MH75]|nr:MAG: hypothetical protein BA863_14910 [Desulfovibrio sp. S3730MH75]
MVKDLNKCIASVSKIIEDEGVSVLYQPVLSLESKGVLGFEAFSRGVDEIGNTTVDPSCLFSSDLPLETQLKVELLCLNSSLRSFRSIHMKYKNMILFLNVNADVYNFDENEDSSPFKVVESFKFNPRSIAFEFEVSQLEKKIPLNLIKKLQNSGYRISLDNSQVTLAGLEVVFRIRPDFIKLDRPFYKGIDKSTHKKEMVKAASLIFMQAGAMPIAKGVETEGEALALAESGFYLQQGFFYTDNGKDKSGTAGFGEKLLKLNSDLRGKSVVAFNESRDIFGHFYLVSKSTITKLQQEDASNMDVVLKELVKKERGIVSAMVVDASGKQLSQRLIGKSGDVVGRKAIPSAPGSDHGHEDYFIYLNSGFERIAGASKFSSFIRDKSRYIASFYYREERRRGMVLILEYADAEQSEA